MDALDAEWKRGRHALSPGANARSAATRSVTSTLQRQLQLFPALNAPPRTRFSLHHPSNYIVRETENASAEVGKKAPPHSPKPSTPISAGKLRLTHATAARHREVVAQRRASPTTREALVETRLAVRNRALEWATRRHRSGLVLRRPQSLTPLPACRSAAAEGSRGARLVRANLRGKRDFPPLSTREWSSRKR